MIETVVKRNCLSYRLMRNFKARTIPANNVFESFAVYGLFLAGLDPTCPIEVRRLISRLRA